MTVNNSYLLLAPLLMVGHLAAQVPSGLAANGIVDEVVAVVGDSVIVRTQVEEFIIDLQAQGVQIPGDEEELADFQRQVLEQLVNQMLVVQAALADSTIIVDDVEVESRLEQEVQRRVQMFGTQTAMQEALLRQGETLQQFRDRLGAELRRDMLTEQYMLRNVGDVAAIPVAEEEIREIFEESGSQLPQLPQRLTLAQVLTQPTASDTAKARAREQAERILSMIRDDGEDFEDMAKRFSDDPSNKGIGGDLGWFRAGVMVREFEDAAFSLGPGRMSGVVETQFGYHIIKMERIRGPERKARHILIRADIHDSDVEGIRKLARDIKRRAEAGEPMAALHDQYGLAEQPDSLNEIPLDQFSQFPPGYAEAVRDAQVGDVLGPIEFGQPPQVTIAVLQVVEILDAGTATYVDVAPFIRSQVQEQRAREQVIESLRSKAHVEVRR